MKKFFLMILAMSFAHAAFAGSYDEVVTPPTYTQAECEAMKDAVWVDASWQEGGLAGKRQKEASACIKYVASDNLAKSPTALIFIDGDVTMPLSDTSLYETLKTRSKEFADDIARQTGLPVIRLARPGTFGSSGMSHFRDRRMPIETYLVDAAVTKIKERYGYQRLQLVGQSTGGGLVGALMTLGRDDIDCAVISSGVTSLKTRSRHLNSDNFQQGNDETGHSLSDVYDPIDHIGTIVPDDKRRIFILGDPRDQAVSFESQREFHEKLVSSGISSTLLVGQANDDKHHILSASGQRIAGLCKNGKSDAEIEAMVKNRTI